VRPLTLLITSARSPYYFSLHASNPADADGGSRKDTGHTFICGPTGIREDGVHRVPGCNARAARCNAVIFDKDRGLEILVRALDGEYLPLKNGVATG